MIKRKKNSVQIALLFAFLAISFFGFAQKNQVSMSVDTTSIKIGEQIKLKLVVHSVRNVYFPKLQLDSLGKVEIVESLPIDTLKNRMERSYILTSFDSGKYVIPKQEISINNRKFFTDSLLISVSTVKVDTLKQKMFEIKAIKSEPKTFDDYKYLLWWLLLLLILIAIIAYFVFRKKEEILIPEKVVAPIVVALQRLQNLDQKQLLKENKTKEYYTELTDIVRTYIEKDLKIPALESTSNELIETINDFNESSNLGLSKEIITNLSEVLTNADFVKFAKYNPSTDGVLLDRNKAEFILKETQITVHPSKPEDVNEIVEKDVLIKKKQPKIKKSNLVLLAVVLALVVFGIVGFLGFTYFKSNFLGNTTNEMSKAEWYKSSYGYPSVTIETPEILKSEQLSLPPNMVALVSDFSVYTYGSIVADFYVGVTASSFKNEMNFDLEGGVQGALAEMENKMGTKFDNISTQDINNNGVPGKLVQASFIRKNDITQKQNDYKLIMLFFANNFSMRQVLVFQLKDDKSAEKVSDRIINSVQLNP